MNRRTMHLLAAMLATAPSLVACGLNSDDAPRDIPAAEQNALGIDTQRPAGAATGTARIYLLMPESAGASQQLTAVARDVLDDPQAVLQALLAGPNVVEIDTQFRTAIPSGTTLTSAQLRGGILRVDISNELLQVSGDTLVGAIAQIVFTASQITGVHGVKILVNGADQQWPAGNGQLQSRALTVYDYPGILPSAQPAYPAVPSPPQG